MHRYFEGIQGDNSKKGELFGIENIFKLHEDKLATKMAVCAGLSGIPCEPVIYFVVFKRIWIDREGQSGGAGLGTGEYGKWEVKKDQ